MRHSSTSRRTHPREAWPRIKRTPVAQSFGQRIRLVRLAMTATRKPRHGAPSSYRYRGEISPRDPRFAIAQALRRTRLSTRGYVSDIRYGAICSCTRASATSETAARALPAGHSEIAPAHRGGPKILVPARIGCGDDQKITGSGRKKNAIRENKHQIIFSGESAR